MKRTLLICLGLALCLVFGISLKAQPESYPATQDPEFMANIQENIWRVGITTCPYEYIPGAETPVPKGFKPFYISHYGRHGARSSWAGGTYSYVLRVFNTAYEMGILTEDGEAALTRLAQVVEYHDGMDGHLMPLGCREHQGIATRMYKKFKKVFSSGNKRVRAVSSISPRCIVSMNAFTGALIAQNPKLDVSWDSGERIMTYCSSDDPRPVHIASAEILNAHHDAYVPDVSSFMKKVFTNPSAARELIGDPVKLMDGVFDMAMICGSFEMDDFLLRLFTWDDLYRYCENLAMNLYLRQCNSIEFGDLRMPLVQPLVDDVIDKADYAITTGDVQVDLRFGHDWQLLAFCSRIGISGVGERRNQYNCRNWQGFFYSPFAGNIQMVFYRNKQGDILVKFYVNERETELIGLEDGPYYYWEDVKHAWLYHPEMGEVEEIVPTRCTELSGLCRFPESNDFLAASDETGLYRVSRSGATAGFFTEEAMDCEGVTVDPDSGDIYYIVEGTQEVWRIPAPDYYSKELVCVLDEFGKDTNLGLEGISWYDGDEFFVANQADPTVLYRYSLSKGIVETGFVKSTTEIADLCYDEENGYLWILDSENFTINICNIHGEMIHSYPIPFIDNAEGLWVDHRNSCVWIGDDTTNQLYKIHFDNL